MTLSARRPRTLLAILLVCWLLAAGATPGAAHGGDVLVVDDDGDAEYARISAALADADDGDTVRVRPGTYRERLRITGDVTVVAPRGATLNGSTLRTPGPAVASVGVDASGTDGTWTVAGFRFVDYTIAVDATGADGGWTLRDVAIENASWVAVSAPNADGDWTVRNLSVRTAETGLKATGAGGDWTVRNASITGLGFAALTATGAEGDWTVANTTVGNVPVGVSAAHTSGNWTLRDVRVSGVAVGVGAVNASGDWTVVRTTIRNVTASERYDFLQPPHREGVAIHAARTTGRWTVRNATIEGRQADVDATEADPAGRTTNVDWAASGPDCTGNVTCAAGVTLATATPTHRGTPSGSATTTDTGPPSSPTETAGHLSPALAVLALLVVAGSRTADGNG